MYYESPYNINPNTDTINTNIDSYDNNEYWEYSFVKENQTRRCSSFCKYNFVGIVTSNYTVPLEDDKVYKGTIHHAIIQHKHTGIYCIATAIGLGTCIAKPTAQDTISKLLDKEKRSKRQQPQNFIIL